MLRLLFTLLFTARCYAELSGQEVFNRVRENVAKQLAAAANYTCVQSTERIYYLREQGRKSACPDKNAAKPEKPFLRDRLRLDVAVSGGEEIFSWHGGSKFSSLGISDVVKSGPISSGSFIGYLQNIFLTAGIDIRFHGTETIENRRAYSFTYSVPLNSSGFRIQARRGTFTVPFHGAFTVGEESFQLETLSVSADNIPAAAELCATDTDISYQMVKISGKDSLIPKSFQLRMADIHFVTTTSTSEYTSCREFRGESTVHFDFDDSAQTSSASAIHDEWLPANLSLHIRLNTLLDDETTFAGDPVEGTLLDAIHVKSANVTIPKGAILQGLVSRMELHYQPARYHVASIRFDRLTFGPNSFLLDATPRQLFPQGRRLASTYGPRIAVPIAGDDEKSSFMWPSSHFHTGRQFSNYWETSAPPEKRNRDVK